jgi:site-specific recombinase XerD
MRRQDPDTALVMTDGLELEQFGAVSGGIPKDRNPVLVYLLGLAPTSRRSLYSALRGVSEHYGQCAPEVFPWWKLGYAQMQVIRSDLAAEYAPSMANKTLSAIRRVLLHCRRLGWMTSEECANASDCGRVRGSRMPPGRALSIEEIQLLAAHGKSTRSLAIRDRAIVMVLAGCGLRRAELVSLDASSYLRKTSQLVLIGKGNKQRYVPLHRAIETALQDWLRVRGDETGPLFCAGGKGHKLYRTRRISQDGVYKIVRRLTKACDIVGIRPHDFRRTFISVLLDQGRDLAVVSKIVGHQSVETTARYDRRGEHAGRKAVEALDSVFT